MLRSDKTAVRTILVSLLVFGVLSLNADSLAVLAEELIRLRTEVETKNAEVESRKQELRSRLKTLAMQKAEIEAAIQKETLRIKQAQVALSRKQAEASKESFDQQKLIPVIEKAITGAVAVVEKGVPFKRKERLAELNDLKTQVATGAVSPFTAIARLWSFYEDEYRMTKENGIFRQSIVVNGEEKLADIARLGTVMMYFRLPDSTVGSVVRHGDQWEYRIEEDKKQRERVVLLFDALKKQIRTGYFELPNVLPPLEK